MSEDLTGTAALLLNASFSSLFSKTFDPQGEEASRNAELSAEARNPFAEIKQKEDAARLAAADTAQGTQDKAVTDSKPAEPVSAAGQEVAAAAPRAADPKDTSSSVTSMVRHTEHPDGGAIRRTCLQV